MIIVYTKNNCPFCDRVKNYLDAKGKEYEVRNINESQEAMNEVIALGVMGVPVTINDNVMIVGWNEAELSKL